MTAKLIASSLAIALLSTQVLFAHRPEMSLWEERHTARLLPNPQLPPLPSLAHRSFAYGIPPQYGTVRPLSPFQVSGQTVIHIQDIHLNPEAQRNIGGALKALIDNGQAGVIALEGAFGPMDLSPLREFPQQDSVKRVTEYLFAQGKISGAAAQLWTGRSAAPVVVGVDDRAHYDANVRAYLDSLAGRPFLRKEMEQARHDLAENKKNFNADLAAFDAEVEAYRAGSLPLSGFINQLAARLPQLPVSFQQFRTASQLESSLDFKEVEQDRNRWLSRLVEKLNQPESAELMNRSADYRMGNLRHSDFYDYVQTLSERKGIPLSQFKSLETYVQYIHLAERIDAIEIYSGLRDLEQNVYAALAKTEMERRTIAESRRLYLQSKLVDFALTSEEWEEYRSLRIANFGLRIDKSFEDFYVEAERRDILMAENLIRELNQKSAIRNPQYAVLVTGGFHSAGINKHLSEAGYRVVTFVPKLTQVNSVKGSEYLSVFAQEKTPLDQLLQGEKLFLSPQLPSPQAGRDLAELHRAAGTNNGTASNGHLEMKVTSDGRILALKPVLLIGIPFMVAGLFKIFGISWHRLPPALIVIGFIALTVQWIVKRVRADRIIDQFEKRVDAMMASQALAEDRIELLNEVQDFNQKNGLARHQFARLAAMSKRLNASIVGDEEYPRLPVRQASTYLKIRAKNKPGPPVAPESPAEKHKDDDDYFPEKYVDKLGSWLLPLATVLFAMEPSLAQAAGEGLGIAADPLLFQAGSAAVFVAQRMLRRKFMVRQARILAGDQHRDELREVASALTRAFNLTNRTHLPLEQLKRDLRALIPVGPHGLNGKIGIRPLSEEDQAFIESELQRHLAERKWQGMPLSHARLAAAEMFTPINIENKFPFDVEGGRSMILDVKIQSEEDIPAAMPRILAASKELGTDGRLYIPVNDLPLLPVGTLRHRLNTAIRNAMEKEVENALSKGEFLPEFSHYFCHAKSGGFYNAQGKFLLKKFLTTVSNPAVYWKGAIVALGDYEVEMDPQDWRYYDDILEFGVLAIINQTVELRRIDSLNRLFLVDRFAKVAA